MLTIAALLLFANSPESQTTLPRHPDPDQVAKQASREGERTDPWFNREYVATDDPAFVLTAVESGRQGIIDARALGTDATPVLREAAVRIEQHERATNDKLEALAKRKGWRLPDDNPNRASTLKAGDGTTRRRANYLLSQIAYHQATVEHYRAQIAGKGDPELKRALRAALPGYEKNLQTLLQIEPSKAL
jgi:predicted outer membrane protein